MKAGIGWNALSRPDALGDKLGMALRQGADFTGIRLLASAHAQREAISCPAPPSTRIEHDRELTHARRRRGDAVVEDALQNPGINTPERALLLARETLGATRVTG